MSILTKICVVVLLVLNLVASVVFIKMAVTIPSWRQAHKSEVFRREVAEQTTRVSQMVAKRQQAELDDVNTAIKELRGESTSQKEKAQRDAAAAKQQYAELMSRFRGLQASVTELVVNSKANTAERAQLRDRVKDFSKLLEERNQTVRELKSDLEISNTQKDRLTSMVKHLNQQFEDLAAENHELKRKLAEGDTSAVNGSGQRAVDTAGPTITGTIDAVSKGVASINIGRSQGIRKNMVLKVYRGPRFVAHLRIDMVGPNDSAGVIVDKVLDVRQSDKVTTDLK